MHTFLDIKFQEHIMYYYCKLFKYLRRAYGITLGFIIWYIYVHTCIYIYIIYVNAYCIYVLYAYIGCEFRIHCFEYRIERIMLGKNGYDSKHTHTRRDVFLCLCSVQTWKWFQVFWSSCFWSLPSLNEEEADSKWMMMIHVSLRSLKLTLTFL
jgi:hypothetical protein